MESTVSVIQAENLTKVYGTGNTAVVALDHVDLSVAEGECVAVMGPSGCGKSTLLHLLGGLDRPSEGNVSIKGQRLAAMTDKAVTQLRRRKIGFVFQFFNLIPTLSSVENAALPLLLDGDNSTEAKNKAMEWLARIGLGQRLDSRPDQLSAGQQQRVAIARALITNPILVLADEPTGNLDTKSADEIAGLLKQVATDWGHTVLMVTHDPRIAAHADRIVFLKDGRVVDEMLVDSQHTDNADAVSQIMKAIA
jgi:putative ABC transport system ATP-binding protein